MDFFYITTLEEGRRKSLWS